MDVQESTVAESRRRSSSISPSHSTTLPSKKRVRTAESCASTDVAVVAADNIVAVSDDDTDDDDDLFEAVPSNLSHHHQSPLEQSHTANIDAGAEDSDGSLPELGTVELTVGEATASVLAPKKRRPTVTKRARMLRRCHHVVDLICQLAAAQMMNRICQMEEIQARCLSCVSPFAVFRICEHFVPGKLEIRREWASSDLRYFLSSYQALKFRTRYTAKSKPLVEEFVGFIESRKDTKPWHRPMLLTTMLRILAFDARLCVGLVPAPLKLTVQESVELERGYASACDIALIPGTMLAHNESLPPDQTILEPVSKADPGVPQYWCEVFDQVSERWLPINAFTGMVEQATQMVKPSKTGPCAYPYIIALDAKNYLRDITRRYTRDFVNTTMRQRIESIDASIDERTKYWWPQWISKWENPDATDRDEREEAEMERSALRSTMPTRISDFANNPYYVLARNLNQNEVIYPSSPVVGKVRGESVYLRENVKTLRTRMAWMREGRVIREGAEPIKTIKQRAVTARTKMAADVEMAAGREPVAELFGEWQTGLFKPQPVFNGHVPRNDYGRIDLFKPTMLPEGAAHVCDPNAKRLCKELGIDAVDAVVAFEFRRSVSTPMVEGVVIPKEAFDLLKDALREHRKAEAEKHMTKIEKRALKRWRRLVVALRVREEIDASFASRSARQDSGGISFSLDAKGKSRSKGVALQYPEDMDDDDM
ncbi:hypothetical protein GGI25_004834 [Coemansia spiralis]|uniref:Rad4-domain-containing protein n=2 Tax=Coemansia TaxID=4863 RepID=A0A9W8FZN8_9FUNG|nr:hypothetical protein EDC05_003553 [Coemansia umbellata]KAJ2621161.1 hypothetical protein GGI26_004329 [Coemansia sp. RSA 1358]KAJ2673081.1 hypothetical protein GGI25_004834 [Coemansia spiralis]